MGERYEVGVGVGEREIIYLSPHCHHQNYSCAKLCSGESHFDVSLIVRDKVHKPQPRSFTDGVCRAECMNEQTPVC